MNLTRFLLVSSSARDMATLHVKSKYVASIVLGNSFLIQIMLVFLTLWQAVPIQCNLFFAVAHLAFKKQNTLLSIVKYTKYSCACKLCGLVLLNSQDFFSLTSLCAETFCCMVQKALYDHF